MEKHTIKIKEMLYKDTMDIVIENKETIINEILNKNPRLLKKLLEYRDEEIRKSSIYKQLLKKTRKALYYKKRIFQTENTHVSILERGEEIQEIIEIITDLIRKYDAKTIADYGCGLFPLTIPKWEYKPKEYYAIDNNKKVIEKLNEKQKELNKYTKLIVIMGDLKKESPLQILKKEGIYKTELALYNRVLHTIYRQSKQDIVLLLDQTPSEIILITEPRNSLVKKTDITKKEKRFIETTLRKAQSQGIISHYHIMVLKKDVVSIVFK